MIYIGLDDTDTLESRGTGHLARLIASELERDYPISGVTRHQLLDDPRVPKTAKNSCAAISIDGPSDPAKMIILLDRVRIMMLDNFQHGSDPGLCIASSIPQQVIDFGHKAQTQLLSQKEAESIARDHAISLIGLGGTNDGIIGALAAVGLVASCNDGRYVQVGKSRDLAGLVTVEELCLAGVPTVMTNDGQPVTCGFVQTDKIRPARRGGKPVAVVEWRGDHWFPLKLD